MVFFSDSVRRLKKNLSAVIILSSLVGLTACKQNLDIQNGVVPAAFVPFAEKFIGSYHGQMELESADLTLSLEEGNRLVLRSSKDFLAPVCRSKVGHLTRVTYEETQDKTVRVTDAFFNFDPNYCGNQIDAKQIHLMVSQHQPLTVDVILLDHWEYGWRCEGMSGPMPYPRYYQPWYPTDRCWEEEYGVYRQGRFIHD